MQHVDEATPWHCEPTDSDLGCEVAKRMPLDAGHIVHVPQKICEGPGATPGAVRSRAWQITAVGVHILP